MNDFDFGKKNFDLVENGLKNSAIPFDKMKFHSGSLICNIPDAIVDF